MAACDDVQDFRMFEIYDDTITLRLMTSLGEVLKIDLSDLFELFGEFFYHYTIERGYHSMLSSLGRDLVTFLNGLDAHHHFLSTYIYGGIKAPSFRCEVMEDGSYVLHYYSTREGLHPVAIGAICQSAKDLYRTDVKISILAKTKEIFGSTPHSHVTLRIDEIDSNGEILVRSGLLNKGIKLLNQSAGVLPPIELDSAATLTLLTNMDFGRILPFHFVFDKELRIRSLGSYLAKRLGPIGQEAKVTSHFKLIHPKMEFDWARILSFVNLQYVVEVFEKEVDRDCLQLKGQMIRLSNPDHILYAASIRVVDLKHLQKRAVYLCDIPSHDSTRDLILLDQMRRAELGMSRKLEETTSDLQLVSRALEKEKAKTDALLNEILPRSVADALKEGREVPASSFDQVTILFSDIVSFTVLSSKSEPNQVIDMLNELFTLFDELSRWNDVYKVETIGDAYMVCGGVPEHIVDHAERVTDMGLGMILVSSQVKSPVDGSAIQIRVGIHTGPVMSGVVGKRMPRYCLFGDTVNTASRMESHGVPGKVQISPSTYASIEKDHYAIEERGLIEVKGKGEMRTYFVLGHASKTIQQLIGRSIEAADETAVQGRPVMEKSRGRVQSLRSSGEWSTEGDAKIGRKGNRTGVCVLY